MGIREVSVNRSDIDGGCKLVRVVWVYVLLLVLLAGLPVLKTKAKEIPEEKVLFPGNGTVVGLDISKTNDRVGTAGFAVVTAPEKLPFKKTLEDIEVVDLAGITELVGVMVWGLGRVKMSDIQSMLTTLVS